MVNEAFAISGIGTMEIATPSSMSSMPRTGSVSAKVGKYSVYIYISWHFSNTQSTQFLYVDNVLSNPQILGVPLLLLANKQDSPLSLSVDDIRHDYEDWHQRKLESARRTRYGETDASVDMSARRERIASLDVMGISAIEGWASSFSFFAAEYIHDI